MFPIKDKNFIFQKFYKAESQNILDPELGFKNTELD